MITLSGFIAEVEGDWSNPFYVNTQMTLLRSLIGLLTLIFVCLNKGFRVFKVVPICDYSKIFLII